MKKIYISETESLCYTLELTKPSSSFFFFFFFFFFGSTHSIWKLNLNHSCSNTSCLTHCAPAAQATNESLTCCATAETSPNPSLHGTSNQFFCHITLGRVSKKYTLHSDLKIADRNS